LKTAALRKRRQHDFASDFKSALGHGIENGQPTVLIFDKSDIASQTDANKFDLDNRWALSNFFDSHAFPAEIFDHQVFNGRERQAFFLGAGVSCTSHLPHLPVSEVNTPNDTPEKEQQQKEEQSQGQLDAKTDRRADSDRSPCSFHLKLSICINDTVDASLNDDEVRHWIVDKMGHHVPVGNCSVVLIQGAN